MSDVLLHILQSAENEESLLAELAQFLRHACGADACDVLLDNVFGGMTLRASTAAPEFISRVRIGPGVGISGIVRSKAKPVFLPDKATEDRNYAHYPGIDDVPSVGLAVVPFGGTGVAMLRTYQPWPNQNPLDITRSVKETRAAYDSYQNIFDRGAKSNRIGALSEVSKTISTSPYLEEILQLLVNLTAQQFSYTVVTVRLLDEASNELVLRATQASARDYQRKRAIKMGESIAGRAMVNNEPIIVPDVQMEAEYIGHDLAVEQNLRSMICVPLSVQDRPVGVISCYTSEVREFPPDEIKALETLAQQAAMSIEHAKLQVRSTLMQEMHHRVKNNLQQVASLLRLQLRHSRYKSLEEAINDTLARILAISSVHDLLSREDLDAVGIRSIAESLVQHQMNSLVLPDRKIAFQVRGDDVRLSMTHATQVALLLNELIQNAVEHGFQLTREGDIHVTVEYQQGEVSLWVSNSGDPLPDDFDVQGNANLGLKIVENLSRGLGGKFKLGNILGWTVAEVKFTASGSE